MSTPAPVSVPAVARTANCEFCHQRPKNAGHRYCGKTCANQAAQVINSNCDYCHQKPKFGTFEYCGKHCAAQAQKTMKPQPQAIQTRAQAATGNGVVPVSTKGTQQTQKNVKAAIVPIPVAGASQVQTQTQQVQGQPAQPQSQSWVKKAASQIPKILTNSSSNQSAINATGVCAIPGCGVAVHVDPNGFQTSDYCSQSHREEAVDSGLVSPCVMCLTMPQSKTDYFCSRLCREEANHKS